MGRREHLDCLFPGDRGARTNSASSNETVLVYACRVMDTLLVDTHILLIYHIMSHCLVASLNSSVGRCLCIGVDNLSAIHYTGHTL